MLEVHAPGRRSYITLPGYRVGMKPPNAGKTYPAEVLTRDEVSRLIAACSSRGSAGLRTRALIVVLYRSGLRIMEALELRRKDIDLEAGTITVLHGKGDRRRTVGIDAQAVAVVEKWLTRRHEIIGRSAGAPVFCTIARPNPGQKMHSSVVRECFKDLAVKAGIDKRVHPHGFRHTHGHNDLATTARYIDHLSPWEVVDAIRARSEWATQD